MQESIVLDPDLTNQAPLLHRSQVVPVIQVNLKLSMILMQTKTETLHLTKKAVKMNSRKTLTVFLMPKHLQAVQAVMLVNDASSILQSAATKQKTEQRETFLVAKNDTTNVTESSKADSAEENLDKASKNIDASATTEENANQLDGCATDKTDTKNQAADEKTLEARGIHRSGSRSDESSSSSSSSESSSSSDSGDGSESEVADATDADKNWNPSSDEESSEDEFQKYIDRVFIAQTPSSSDARKVSKVATLIIEKVSMPVRPHKIESVQDKVAADVTHFIKRLYDHTKSEEETPSREALPELIVKDFDEEQIWQELELQNEEKSTKFIRDVAHMVALKNKLVFPIQELDEWEGSEDEHSGEESESDQSEKLETRKQIPNKDTLNVARKKANHSKKQTKVRSSVVDDQFFKLGDLEKFLDKEDKKEGQLQKKKKTEGDSSEDSNTIDYFQDIPSEEESDNENVEAEGNRLHYSDFFDDPDVSDTEYDSGNGGEADDDDKDSNFGGNKETEGNDEDEEMSDSESEDKGYESKKKVRFDFGKSSGSDSENEVSNDEEPKTVEKLKGIESKSNFETRQERLKLKISHLEEKSLSDKPWQLKGEVSATTRPQNSLLEEALEFDLTTRPAPVITEETTLKLEDIICQRIKDKLWDDVERKIKPVETPYEYKKKLTLNQEKSKLSLAQVYEQEYLKQKEAQNPNAEEKPEEEPESHKEIRTMMTALFNKLDALSNFHYTPRAVAPDVQIVSNLPAITIEEVAPVAASDAALLAPEEVKGNKQ
uniref:Uncharacterized protein n=1 Tax=Timema cristinae TaxID=61476 RepID=A0A7R9CHB8_TIMCR|nr:unnamed protein product [Timema cristinae]